MRWFIYWILFTLWMISRQMSCFLHAHSYVHKGKHKHVTASNGSMSWLVPLWAAFREPGDSMRPFEPWLLRGRSIVKDSWASCFLLSLWGQRAPNMRRSGFYHPLSPSPPHISSSIDCDCLSSCLKPIGCLICAWAHVAMQTWEDNLEHHSFLAYKYVHV